MKQFSIHLIDTNEPSNILLGLNSNILHCFEDFGVGSRVYQNKLLVLCKYECLKEGDLYLVNGKEIGTCKKDLEEWLEKNKTKLSKVIATNSKKITPNCYINEDRVKEFVEYWNKWKELPKFDIGTKTSYSYERLGNHIQIKWLPKEESKVEAHISEVSETAFDLLIECELQLEYLNQKFGQTGTTNALISKLKNFTQNK